jgi:proteasome lid subunit RPN8/RPN11
MLEQMVAHLAACLPEEGCGLVGGLGQAAQRWSAVENSLHSPVRFRMDAARQLAVLQQFEADNLELLAIIHSHPHGPPHPSSTDLAEFYYPGVFVLIAVPFDLGSENMGTLVVNGWNICGFQIEPQGYLAVKLGIQ